MARLNAGAVQVPYLFSRKSSPTGPAPRTLWRAAISLDSVDGQIVVNFIQRQDPDPKSTAEGLMVPEEPREVEPYFIKV
jgi:hypothetical protein